jgi:hypothetical protein
MTIGDQQDLSSQIKWRMDYVGNVSLSEEKSKVKMPEGIPKSIGGVYQIIAPELFQHYVGESNNLFRRFYTDYGTSFHSDVSKRKTNQMVVSWIHDLLPEAKIEVYLCTRANLCTNSGHQFDLDFNVYKYHRLLVESSIISCRTDLNLINK